MIECPICGATQGVSILIKKIKGSRTAKYNPLYNCKECDSLFQRPNYHEDDNQLKVDLQWHLAKRENNGNHVENVLHQGVQIAPDAKTLLDIGRGIGDYILKSKEFGLSAQGIEPNPYAVKYAKDNLSLNLILAYFGADSFNTKFDVVIVDSVLEHVPMPRTFIQDVFAILNRGGILYLAVPGRRGGIVRIVFSLIFPTSKLSLFADNDVHINHFSRKSISMLIEPYSATLHHELHPGAYIIQAKA